MLYKATSYHGMYLMLTRLISPMEKGSTIFVSAFRLVNKILESIAFSAINSEIAVSVVGFIERPVKMMLPIKLVVVSSIKALFLYFFDTCRIFILFLLLVFLDFGSHQHIEGNQGVAGTSRMTVLVLLCYNCS